MIKKYPRPFMDLYGSYKYACVYTEYHPLNIYNSLSWCFFTRVSTMPKDASSSDWPSFHPSDSDKESFHTIKLNYENPGGSQTALWDLVASSFKSQHKVSNHRIKILLKHTQAKTRNVKRKLKRYSRCCRRLHPQTSTLLYGSVTALQELASFPH